MTRPYINSSGILVSNDIYGAFNKITSQKKLFITRIVSLIIGGVSISLALYSKDILELLLIANNFYVPIVSVPLILSIFGFRSSSKSVLIGMFAGLFAVVLWRLFIMNYINIDSILPGVFFNLICLFGSHHFLCQSGGWVIKGKAKNSSKILYSNILKDKMKSMFFYQKNLSLNKKMYIFFSIFIIISTLSSIYSLKFIVRSQLGITIEIMGFIALFTSTIFFYLSYLVRKH